MKEDDWLPIEDAPSHEMLLFYIPEARREDAKIQTGYYGITANKRRIYIIGNQFADDVGGRPTMFQYLPKPPKEMT